MPQALCFACSLACLNAANSSSAPCVPAHYASSPRPHPARWRPCRRARQWLAGTSSAGAGSVREGGPPVQLHSRVPSSASRVLPAPLLTAPAATLVPAPTAAAGVTAAAAAVLLVLPAVAGARPVPAPVTLGSVRAARPVPRTPTAVSVIPWALAAAAAAAAATAAAAAAAAAARAFPAALRVLLLHAECRQHSPLSDEYSVPARHELQTCREGSQ